MILKPVFIIAIVSVAMIGILFPMTVFGGIMTETLPALNIDKTMYSLGDTIKISGHIENPIRDISVDLVLTHPDHIAEEFRVAWTGSGDYSMLVQITPKYRLGEYSLTSHHNWNFVGKETFSIITKPLPEPTKNYYVKNNLVYTMEDNSMEPTIRKGDVVIAEKIPFENIKIGDMIMHQHAAYKSTISATQFEQGTVYYPAHTVVSKVITIFNSDPKMIGFGFGTILGSGIFGNVYFS